MSICRGFEEALAKKRVRLRWWNESIEFTNGRRSLWKVMPWDVSSLNRTILLGVGWRSYMDDGRRLHAMDVEAHSGQ